MPHIRDYFMLQAFTQLFFLPSTISDTILTQADFCKYFKNIHHERVLNNQGGALLYLLELLVDTINCSDHVILSALVVRQEMSICIQPSHWNNHLMKKNVAPTLSCEIVSTYRRRM